MMRNRQAAALNLTEVWRESGRGFSDFLKTQITNTALLKVKNGIQEFTGAYAEMP